MATIPNPSTFVLAVYASCGGLLVCCTETQLKFVRVMIAVNFGFLFSALWRFLFYVLMGSVTWAYDEAVRQKSYTLLAEAYGLKRMAEAAE